MKERLLVLAKAAPEKSKKYEELVCVAGLTENGEWRRIYPIPWKIFRNESDKKFKKKQWIEYELRDIKPSDHRPESRKIKYKTIKVLGEAPYNEIYRMLKKKLTTIDDLNNADPKEVSLGAIRPKKILDYQPLNNKKYMELLKKREQTTLFGERAYKLEPPEHKYQYVFISRRGKKHKLICEDWESIMLYHNCKKMLKKGKYSSIEEVHEKVKEKMLKIACEKYSFLVVGTHYRFPTYLVVGVVYPKKKDIPLVEANVLENYC